MVVVKQTIVEAGMTGFIVSGDLTPQLLNNVPELDKVCQVGYYNMITYCKAGENFFRDITVLESDSTFFSYEWSLSEFSPDGTYESYTSEE